MLSTGRDPNSEPLTVEVERDGEALVISPVGELDLATTQTLDAHLRKAINGHAPEVILDLRGLSFIDSTGVRLLLFAAAHSRSNGHRLRMLRGSEAVERVLVTCGLERSLPFLD